MTSWRFKDIAERTEDKKPRRRAWGNGEVVVASSCEMSLAKTQRPLLFFPFGTRLHHTPPTALHPHIAARNLEPPRLADRATAPNTFQQCPSWT